MQILLAPYKESKLINADDDFLNNVRYLYYKIQNLPSQEVMRKEKLEKAYLIEQKKMELFLSRHHKMKIQSLDDANQLVELFFSEREISNLLDEYEGESQKEAINWWYINNIFRIAESLLTFRDGKIAIRTWVNEEDSYGKRDIFEYYDALNKAEIWNILSRMIVPDVFVAAFHVECGWTDKKYVYNQLGTVSLADKELDVVLERGWAENHMHFNAGISYFTLWEEFTNPFKWSEKIRLGKPVKELEEEDKKWVLHMILYRIIMAEFMRHGQDITLCDFIEKEYGNLAKSITFVFHEFKEGKNMEVSRVRKVFLDLCDKWKIVYCGATGEQDFLFENIYNYDVLHSPSAEILFQIQVLNYIKKHSQDTHNMHLFMQYLRIKNNYFAKRIQSDDIGGFRYFQKYYSQATLLEKYDEEHERKRIRAVFENQIQNTNLKKMEVRITPPLFMGAKHYLKSDEMLNREIKQAILMRVEMILDEYLKCIKQYVGEPLEEAAVEKIIEQNNISLPQIGIVFHFIKSNYLDNRTGSMCWLRQVKKKSGYNKHILAYRESMIRSAEAIEELRGEIPILNEYIVGIDAASEELFTEPWVMAPIYRGIRNRRVTKPIVQNEEGDFKRIQNLGFTYHVGEEFRHVLSGLRYIDEVIEHFGYKAADRIGHAIALGVDIDYWVQKNEVVTMPVNEYLENLIWIWGNIVYNDMKLPVSAEVLEGRILKFAQKIYGDVSGMTTFMLYEAYSEKFKRYHNKTFEKMGEYMEGSKGESEHFCGNYNCEKSPMGNFWTKEKLVCTHFCPIYWNRFREPILVSVRKDDTDLFKEIQCQIIRKIEKNGIYVETNPTSNSVIGEMPGILCHPILKLNSQGLQDNETNSVLVTINSDDPVVFNTNSENEIAYVYYALLHNGYDKERVLKWIDKVRCYGMESSFIKVEKSPVQQIREMKQLLERIRKR